MPFINRQKSEMLVIFFAGAALFFGCSSARTKEMSASQMNPAGKGTVQVRRDSNQNTQLNVEVKHLARPERLSQSATTYVVWAAPTGTGDRPLNLGGLRVNDNLDGQIQTLTPLKSFDLFITAEPNAFVQIPSGEPLLWTQINTGTRG